VAEDDPYHYYNHNHYHHRSLVTRQATSSPQERQPWDVFRFLRQSSRFVNILPTTNQKAIVVQPGDVLWKPSSTGKRGNTSNNKFIDGFAPLDDVVMGGVSSSQFDVVTGKWTGQVTDANNGGFVGIRSIPSTMKLDMSKCNGIEFSVYSTKQKQKVVKVAFRDSPDFNGIVWTSSINLKGANGEVLKVPFSKLIPTRFAKTIDGVKFSPDSVTGMQFVYSKYEYDGKLNPTFSNGDLDVQIEQVRAY
jgi:hypothetical protein